MIKQLKKLPTLKDNQSWCCERGCDVIKPKLSQHAYSLSWDNDGNLTDKKVDYYYTCQRGHLLEVWDEDKGPVDLDERFYQELDPKSELTIELINHAINELEQHVNKFENSDPEFTAMFSGVDVSYCLTLKNGEKFSAYLEDFKALRDRLLLPEPVYVME